MATPTANYNLLKPGTGESYNVQTLDDNYDKIDHQLGLSLPLLAVGGVAAGSSPLGGANPKLLVQAGTDVFTFGANTGVATHVFPQAFPNGLITYLCANGDIQVDASTGVNWDLGVNSSGTGNAPTKSQVVLQILSSTGTIPTVSHALRVNWIAIGF